MKQTDSHQDADNLAWRVAEAFFARTGKRTSGLEIFINKRIPTEAGLGGGSADAAAVLRGLNRYYGEPLSIAALCETGEAVGSDVPFCVLCGTAQVEGRGELLTQIPGRAGVFRRCLQAGLLRLHGGAVREAR